MKIGRGKTPRYHLNFDKCQHSKGTYNGVAPSAATSREGVDRACSEGKRTAVGLRSLTAKVTFS